MTNEDHIVLKWGTLKEWKLTSKKGKELLREYIEIGASLSAMAQKDTPRQMELICEMIDECPGDVLLAWEEKYVGKEEAKRYVIEYGRG